MKFDNLNNEEGDKNKLIHNRIKFSNKKNLIKGINNNNLNITNINQKDNICSLKYFNSFISKKDKIELHDNLANNNKSLKKNKKYYHDKIIEENPRKSQESDEEIIKLKKLSIVIDSRKKSKKKLIDSPDNRRVYRYSNFTMNTNIANNSNRFSNEKNNRKNKRMKE